jgi:hypothetical protein
MNFSTSPKTLFNFGNKLKVDPSCRLPEKISPFRRGPRPILERKGGVEGRESHFVMRLLPATKKEDETFVLHNLLPHSFTFIKETIKRNLGNAGLAHIIKSTLHFRSYTRL